ncbi:tetratricopeptide repeat protein [Acanthopleuribacter pedis]|uniref:Tetratricopeptide repeat protein n=1 Tax=Acanthopleuribacter pedis TaxID=442870 RepID=A0A8J7QKS9_9BACT|nr:tetratricopeptide repeat protein [Acanthopleuribacter pedis]MBO1321740.1 tetratricopeptide repeat protein [Acanthopleuribacter pedis]
MTYELQDFQTDVVEASIQTPVLIDFWAPWCGPCTQLSPTLEKMADEAKGAWKLVKINVDEHPHIAGQFQVQGIPFCVLVFGGQLVDMFQGVKSETELRQWFAERLGDAALPLEDAAAEEPPVDPGDPRQQATGFLVAGKFAEAAAAAEQVVLEDDSDENRVFYARCAVFVDPEKVKAYLARISEDAEQYDVAQKFIGLARVLMNEDDKLPEHANSKLAGYYREALQATRAGEFEQALDAFLEVLYRDKSYDEDGARLAFIGLFEWLGRDHDVVKAYQRRFEMAVFG